MGWGGKRPGSGPKPKAQKPAAAKPQSRALVKVSDTALARSRSKRAPQINAFVLANHPPSVFPHNKRPTMAMDEAVNASLAWSAQAILNGMFTEGLGFLGYPYLAELTQRAEYRALIDTIAEEATREWIKMQASTVTDDKDADGDVDEDDAEIEADAPESEDKTDKLKAIEAEFERLKVQDVFRLASTTDGFFGRSHIFIDVGNSRLDQAELLTPIGNGRNDLSVAKVTKGTKFRLQNIEPIWAYPSFYNATDPLAPGWYKPEHWFVMGKELHASRLLTFVGRPVPDLLKPAYSFGGLSLSQMAKPYVDNWLRTRQSVADIVHAFSVMVLSTDLSESLSVGGDELFRRLDFFNNTRDNRGVMAVNKETEDLKNVSAPLGSLDALQAQTQEHMAAVSKIPIVKLLGIQPAGLNASSEGEIKTFDDTIAAYQEKFFGEPLKRILGFVQLSLFGVVDPQITAVFNPLRQMTEKEKGEIDKANAEADQIRIDTGVISPEEARHRLAAEEDSPYSDIDPNDVPEPPEEPGMEPGAKQPPGGEPDGGGGGGGGDDPFPGLGGGANDAVIPFDGGSDASFNEADHPRGQPENAGQFGSGGGGSSKKPEKTAAKPSGGTAPAAGTTHHIPAVLKAPWSKETTVNKDGSIKTSNVNDAARALYEKRKVDLDQPKTVSVLIEKLGAITKNMIELGEEAPTFNLCEVSVKGANLFCADTKGIPRIKMPQLDEDQTKAFRKYLKSKGYTVEKTEEKASFLRATQNELLGWKVAKQAAKIEAKGGVMDKRIVVSRDNYILDGHHHWAGQIGYDAKANGKLGKLKTKISRVDISITDLLAEADKFTGGKGKKGGTGGGAVAKDEVFDAADPWDDWDWACDSEDDEVAEDEFHEADHPRGQPGNAGQFGSGGGGKSKPSASAKPPSSHQVAHAPQFGLQHGHFTAPALAGGFTPSSAKRGNIGEPLDPAKLKKVGGAMGSNPGGVYEDEDGKKYYVKKGKSKDHVRNEMTAAALYRLAGTPTLHYRPTPDGTHVATEMAKLDKDNASKLSKSEKREAARDFAAHAWLGNWDVVGLGGDNLGTVKGMPTALDLGGAMEYRAQGAPKGKAFGNKVGEIDTLRDKGMNRDAHGIFGAMTPAEMRESARYVTEIKDDKIRATVEKMGGSKALAEKLIARKQDIAKQAALFGAHGDPAKPDGTMVVPAGGKLPIKTLNGVKFAPWRPPADWNAVDGTANLNEPEFIVPEHKKPSTGVIIREPDGRVWMVQPRGAYGGYEGTFPKGGVEDGLSLQANAIKEAWEESGLKVRITGFAGDHPGDMTMTRYYHAEREGGDPSSHEDESEGVVLAPADKAAGFLNRERDRAVLAHDQAVQDVARAPGDPLALFELVLAHDRMILGDSTPIMDDSEEYPDDPAEPAEPLPDLADRPLRLIPLSSGAGAGQMHHPLPIFAPVLARDDANWEESKHPRDHGKFATVAGGSGGATPAGGSSSVGKFASKKAHVAHLLTEGTTTKAILEATGWPSVSVPAMAKAAGLKLTKFKEGGVVKYKGTPMTVLEKAQAKTEAMEKAKAKAAKAGLTAAQGAVVQQVAEISGKTFEQVAAVAAVPKTAPKMNFPPPTAAELEKAKKNIKLQLQYVPGAPQDSYAAQKLVDKFNEKYEGKTLTEKADLVEKVSAFKQLQKEMIPLMSAQQQQAAKTQAEQQAKAQANAKIAAEKAKKANEEAKKQFEEQHAEITKELGITAPAELEAFDSFVAHFGGVKSALTQFKSWQSQAQQAAKQNPGHGFEKLSGFEMGCIKAYTGPQSGWINKAIIEDSQTPAQYMFEKVLNAALDKLPKVTGKIQRRGLTLPSEVLAKMQPGKIWTHRNFGSSSNSGWSGNTKLHITTSGKNGAYVDPISSHQGEGETLFKSNLRLLIDKVEKSGNTTHVHCREM